MKKNILAAISMLVATSPAFAELGQAREVSCLIIEDGETKVDGPCEFDPTDGFGSFDFKTYNGKFWGSFYSAGDGIGEVVWNGEPYASHAHNIQRDLLREEACWVNDYATFCFWDDR